VRLAEEIISHAPFGVLLIDSRFRLLQISEGARKVFAGISPLIGRDFGEVLGIVWPEPFATEAIERFRETLENGTPFVAPRTIEKRANSPEVETYDWSLVRIRLEDGSFGVICYFMDLTERRQAEQKTSEARHFLQETMDALGSHVAVLNEHGIILAVNEAWRRFAVENQFEARGFGVGSNYVEVCESNTGECAEGRAVAAGLRELLAGKRSHFEFEYPCHSPDQERWFLLRASRFRGEPVRLVIAHEDVTEQHLAARRLRESEERFRNMADHAPVMIWVTEPNGNCVFLNQTWYQYTGQRPETGLGAGWVDAVHPDDQERTYSEFSLANQEKRSFRIDYRLKDRAGNYRWFLDAASPRIDPDGKFLGYIGSVVDISERKEAELALRESQQRFALVTEATEVGFWFCDLPFAELNWDPRVKEHFGLQPHAQVTIDTFYERLHPDDRERTRAAIATSIETRTKYDIEYRTVALEGRERWIRAIGRTFYNEVGKPIRFDGMTMDVTLRKKNDDALREAQNKLHRHAETLEATVRERTLKLEETVAELEAFSYSISHDMRSPLRAMYGFSRALIEDHSRHLDSAALGYLGRIERAAKRLDLLIQDVLAYSQVAKGEFRLGRIDLGPLVADLMDTFDFGTAEFELRPLPVVRGHEGLLMQVISNLIGNAVKFRQRNTKPKIIIGHDDEGETVRVWVQDNGIGIEQEHFHRIFKIYGRIYSEKEFEGTGIGLAIVKKAVERMDGQVGVTSEPGQGSTFWFRLKKY
jgi:PAS domain S-box-containing protein